MEGVSHDHTADLTVTTATRNHQSFWLEGPVKVKVKTRPNLKLAPGIKQVTPSICRVSVKPHSQWGFVLHS